MERAPLEITINGTGSAIHPAERAILVLEAKAEGQPTPGQASAVVTRSANIIRDTITPYCPQDEATGRTVDGAPIAHYSMSTLDTSSHRNHVKTKIGDFHENEVVITYEARAKFNIKFHDFSALNKLATEFSAMDHIKILSIDWRLTDATLHSIRGGARKNAARDAIQKAVDYAEAFVGADKDKVRPVTVKEDQYYSQSTRPHLHYGKGMRGHKTGQEELQFEPEDVSLDVKVECKFLVDI
jgi:uncharacterized protein YggE